MDQLFADPDSDFVKQLKQYMVEHGIDQGELAKKLGVSQGAVSHWLSGRSVCKNQDVMLAKLGLAENTGGAAGPPDSEPEE